MKASAGLLGGLLLLLGACSAAQEKRLADGSWQIRCGESMQRCASRADLLCGDAGYEVTGGGSRAKVLGGPTGYRTRVQASELVVRCGADGSSPGEEAPSSLPSLPKAPAAPQCVPGATLACVGPGGCSGGQACREDGAGFDPCDCGGEPPRTSPLAPARDQAPAKSPHPAAESSAAESSTPGAPDDAVEGEGWAQPGPPDDGGR